MKKSCVVCSVSVAGIGSYVHKYFMVAGGNQLMSKEVLQLQ